MNNQYEQQENKLIDYHAKYKKYKKKYKKMVEMKKKEQNNPKNIVGGNYYGINKNDLELNK